MRLPRPTVCYHAVSGRSGSGPDVSLLQTCVFRMVSLRTLRIERARINARAPTARGQLPRTLIVDSVSTETRMGSWKDLKRLKSAPIRAGIVGAGLMGRWHAQGIKRVGGRLSAVIDLNDSRALKLAARYRGARGFSDVEQVLRQTDLDVLHVCTPASTHRGIAELAIEAGLHLIIEKPVTPEAADTELLVHRAADRGLLLCPVHQFIFQDGVLKAKKALRGIGPLIHIEATFCSAGGMGVASEELDLIVADILPHPLSLAQVFLPTALVPKDWITMRPDHGELRASTEVRDITVSIFISMSARPTVCSFQLVGRDGTIHLDLFHGYTFVEPGNVSKLRKIVRPFDLSVRRFTAATLNLSRRTLGAEFAYPGLHRLIGSCYAALRTGGEPPIAPQETVAVARVRDALIRGSGLRVRA